MTDAHLSVLMSSLSLQHKLVPAWRTNNMNITSYSSSPSSSALFNSSYMLNQKAHYRALQMNTDPLYYQPKPLIGLPQTLLPTSPKLATSWTHEANSAKQGQEPIMCSCCQRSLKLSVYKLLCGLMVIWNLKHKGWAAAISSLVDNVELVRAQESITGTSDDLFAIPNADIEERDITAKHRICSHGSHIRFFT